jgi:hypothetical protein
MRVPNRAFIVGFLLVTVNIAFADKVRTDFDHQANFSKYRTFMWQEQPAVQDPFMAERITRTVNAQLAARNMHPVTSGADLVINANMTTQEVQTLNTYYSGDGFGWGWGGGGWATTYVDVDIMGTVVVNLVDSRTERVVWQGTGTDRMSSHADKRTKAVDKMVEKMFREFPPIPE